MSTHTSIKIYVCYVVLVDGDPLQDITVLNDYQDKFKVIMKGGKIHKNTL
ncbi:hypothetical protein ACB087_04455 [Vibrio sp. VNB-15]